MVEKGRKDRKIGLFQPSKSPKIPEKSRQNSPNPGKMTEKERQNTGGGHPLRYRGAGRIGDRLSPVRSGAACPGRSVQRAGGGAGVLYNYVAGRGVDSVALIGAARGEDRRRGSSARRGRCPVLYSYVGRGRGWYGAGGAAVWCWCEVWPVWAAVWGCCPVLYSYVGRGRGAAVVFIGRARPHRGGASCPVSSAAGCSIAGGGARCGPGRV